MAFTKGYKHDVFISYARADDRPVTGAERGWVTTFAADLATTLSQRLRCDADIWFDERELRGNVPLSPAIIQALRETATFVVVVSTRYLASEWCRRERVDFLRLVESRARVGSRMFKIEIDEIHTDGPAGVQRLPTEFDGLIGYKFWTKAWQEPVPRTLGWPLPSPSRDQDYYDEIKSLSYELAEELERINREAEPGARPEVGPQATVYLAEVTDDLERKREKVKAHLKQFGFETLPKTWRTYDKLETYQRAVDDDLEKCQLFVQLLSGVAGKRPFDQPLGYPRLQYERAALAGKTILQWREETLKTDEADDDDQRALLEGRTVRAEAFDEFKKAVVKAATPRKDEPAPPRHAGKFVFVSADAASRSHAEAIICDSLRRKGISYAMPPSGGDPEVARKFLEVSLTNCDAALVIYCETDIATVFSQAIQCRKVIAQRERPLPLIAVFDAPPPVEKEPLPFSFDNLVHLDCRRDPTALDRFLDSL